MEVLKESLKEKCDEERLCADKMNYIFLDEIQHVESYQKAVDSLFLKENCDVYITGSNAYFMSGELATLLTGRYVELSMTMPPPSAFTPL